MPSPRTMLVGFLALLLLGLGVGAILAHRSADACGRQRVSALTLTHTPDRYEGCAVTTSGPVTSVFDDRAVFFRSSVYEPRRLLIVFPSGSARPGWITRGTDVEVTGRFHGFFTASDLGLSERLYGKFDGRPYIVASSSRPVAPNLP